MMKMILHYDLKAEFFFEGWKTDGSVPLFSMAVILTILIAAFISVVFFRVHNKRVYVVWEPFLEFVGMYILMCYNFWIVLAYITGRTLGYAWALHQQKIAIHK